MITLANVTRFLRHQREFERFSSTSTIVQSLWNLGQGYAIDNCIAGKHRSKPLEGLCSS